MFGKGIVDISVNDECVKCMFLKKELILIIRFNYEMELVISCLMIDGMRYDN